MSRVRGADALPAFSIWDATVVEGDQGLTSAVFVITLSPPATNTLYIRCAAGPATASTNDFVPSNSILTFEPGVTNATFTVPVKGNTTYESNEFFRVHLTFDGFGATVARSPAIGTIVDDDAVAGRLDHFVVEPFTTAHYAMAPFPVAIRAVDFAGTTVTNFQGIAALGCDTDYGSVTRFFDDFEDGDLSGWTNRGVAMLAQTTTNAAAIGQRSLEVYGYGSGPYGFEHPFAFSIVNRVSFFARASRTNSGGELSLVTRAFGGYGPPFTFFFNNNGLMGLRDWRSQFFGVPYVVSNWYKVTIELTWRPELNDTLDFYVNDSLTFTNIGFRDRYSAPVDHVMVRAGSGTSVWFDEIRIEQTNLHLNIPIYPTQVQFSDGGWQGELIAGEYAPKAILRVDDGWEHAGQSEFFDVLRPLALSLTMPTSTSEDTGVIVATVSIPLPLSKDHLVSLLSLRETVVAVPNTVVIPAGSTSISFEAQILDDADLDGTQNAEVVVSSPYFTSVTNRILVHDSEIGRLTISLPEPAQVSEGGGSIQGAVLVDAPVAIDVTVRLFAEPANQISLPAQVSIPAGQTSTVFTVSALNDRFIDGTLKVTLLAEVEHWIDGTTELEALDDEHTNLVLTTTGNVSEGQGARTNFAAVRLSGQPLTNVIVELISSDPTELQVPAFVTIPAGQTSLVFQVTLIDDSDYDGAQSVTLTARAAGFAEASRIVTVLDNEVHHVAFLPVTGVKTSAVPFAVTLQRRDINDQPLLEYGGPPILLSLTATNVDGNPLLIEPQQLSASGVGASVTIFTPPTVVRLHVAGETFHAESNPFEVTVRPIQTFNLSAVDLAYDSVSGNIYAAVTNNSGFTTNQVIALDTQTGRAGLSTGLPGIPNKLAVSANGEFLYVGFEETNIVMRLDLPSLHTNLVFTVEGDTPGSRLFVESMLVLPSNPRAVVIARRTTWNTSPRHEGVAVYDDGVKRPVHTDDHTGSNAIDFGPTEDILYGTTLEVSPSSFFHLRLSPSGVVTERRLPGGVDSFYEREIDYDAGFVYAGLGHVIDPGTARTVHRFYSTHVKPDSGIDRITTLQAPDNTQTVSLSFFEQHARVFLGAMSISNVYGKTRGLIRWGTNGLAFANSGGRFGFPAVTVPSRVFLLRSPWLVPGPAADLSIQLRADTALGLVNQDVVYTASVSNAGPNSVSNVLVRHRLPWISLTASKPHSVASGDIKLPGLGVGETVTLNFVCQTNKPFALSNVVWVGSAAADLDLSNNIASVVTPVTFYTTTDQVVEWPGLRVKDIVWDPRGQKIYAITPPAAGSGVDSLVAIDPARATVGPPYPLGTNAWRLEVSHLGEYLYVLQGTSTVRRFSLPVLDSHFQFQSLEDVSRIAIAPENPIRVAIYGRDRVRIYDNGAVLARAYTNAAVGDITFGTSPARLYVLTGSGYYLFKFNVTSGGLFLQDEGVLSLSPAGSPGSFAGGRFYMRDGSIYDAESRTKVGQLTLDTAANRVLPDLAKGLVYAYSYPRLSIHDAERFNTRAVIEPLYSVSFAYRIIRWGDDGLAFRYADQLTILRTSHIGDLDRDGLSDAWERTYFGSTNSPASLPNNDADGDGLLNWKEFVAGTDPTDPQAALRIYAALEGGIVRLRFASIQTKYYNIERTSNLSANQWTTIARNIAGTGGMIELADPRSASEPAFYRLKVLD